MVEHYMQTMADGGDALASDSREVTELARDPQLLDPEWRHAMRETADEEDRTIDQMIATRPPKGFVVYHTRLTMALSEYKRSNGFLRLSIKHLSVADVTMARYWMERGNNDMIVLTDDINANAATYVANSLK
jgi:hypothetical protein